MRLYLTLLSVLISFAHLSATVSQPRVFVENRGQWSSHILYAAPAASGTVLVTRTGMMVVQSGIASDGSERQHAVSFDVIGSVGCSNVVADTPADLPRVHSTAARGPLTSSLAASRVVTRNVLPGVHLEYVWEGDAIRYNVLVDAQHTLPSKLFSVKGASNVHATTDGFSCTTDLGDIAMAGTVAYLDGTGKRLPVRTTSTKNTIGFDVANRSAAQAMVVDPIITVRTIKGTKAEDVTSVARDREGNLVIAGSTTSVDLVVPSGGAFAMPIARRDGFIACVAPDLSRIIAWTYVAGDSNETVNGIAIAPNGDIWATGESNSRSIAPAELMTGTATGTVDGFVLRFSNNLAMLHGGVWLPGNNEDRPLAIAVEQNGIAAVCGQTNSTFGLINAPGFDRTHNGDFDAFYLLIDPLGRSVTSSSYMGGRGDDAFTTVTFDGGGSVVLGGWTTNNNFPTHPQKTQVFVPDPYDYYNGGRYEEQGQNPYDISYNGGQTDAVCVKFNNEGQIIFSTYLGGGGVDRATRVLTDNDNRVVLVGTTTSDDLPVLPAGSTARAGGVDVFAAGLTADGLRLRSCMYYGGSRDDVAHDAILRDAASVIVVGATNSSDIPEVGPGSSGTKAAGVDGFLAVLMNNETLISTVFGQDGDDIAKAVVRDDIGDLYIAGVSSSTLGDQLQSDDHDVFVSKFAFGAVTLRALTTNNVCSGARINLAWVAEGVVTPTTYSLEYSPDGGTTWESIASNLSAQSFSWVVPDSITASRTGTIRVRSNRGHVSGTPANLIVDVRPTFITQPQSGEFCVGGRIEISSGNVTGAAPTFVWRKNGQPVAGATSATLVIESASADDAGTYSVVATTGCGSTTSADALVGVTSTPAITTQPESANLNAGASTTLSVAARGPNLRYQWEFNDSPIEGATSATLQLTDVGPSAAGRYRCVVTSDCGTTTSDVATINVGLVSVDEERSASLVAVFPNPAQSTVTISTADASGLVAVDFVDAVGNTVVSRSYNGQSKSAVVRIDSLASGVYTVIVRHNNGTQTSRLAVQR